MSGYLQRLVDTASGRGGAVHPRTGSVFSPQRQDAAAPLPQLENTETVAPAPPRAPSREPQLEPEPASDTPDTPPRGSRESRAYVPLMMSPAPDAPVPLTAAPLLARVAPARDGEPIVPVLTGDVHDRRRREPADRHTVQHATNAAPVTGTDAATEAGHGSRAAVTAVARLEGQRRSASSRTAPARRGAAAEREPDDIQIHIGRIEVVAVPPPAPRAPKAPDRSPSLDAYLSRRDGRRQ